MARLFPLGRQDGPCLIRNGNGPVRLPRRGLRIMAGLPGAFSSVACSPKEAPRRLAHGAGSGLSKD